MAQTLKFGNGNFATKAGSTLCYDDQNGNFKPIPMDFTRSTSATRVNKQGLIEVVTNDRPRIDYTDTSDGVLLLEKAATNLITYSEDFASDWILDNTTVVINSAISPNGSLNADKIIATAINGSHSAFVSLSSSTSSGTSYCYSFFAKAEEYTKTAIRIGGGGYSTQPMAVINLLNGTVVSQQGFTSVSVADFNNGWYKIIAVFTSTSSVAANIQPIADDFITTADNYTYTGDGTSGVYIWGAMFEQNSVASSYIPTQGSASTRVAETATGAGNSEVFNNIEGTIFLDVNFKNNSGVQVLCSVDDFATNKRLEIWANSNLINGFIGGSSSITVGSSNIINGSHKIALSYKSGNSSFYIDGFLIGSSSSSFTISALTKMNLSYFNGNQYASECPTKEIGYYNTILTDLELETLTSYKSWTSMVNELNLNIIYNG